MIKLDVDVDFAQVKGMVALRFFETFEDGRRLPVRTQRLYNFAVQCRKNPNDFRPDDRELLKRLAKELSKPSVLSRNLQIITLTQPQWNTLRSGTLASRFRDAKSGRAYSDKLAKAPLYFELVCHGEKTLFSAVVDLPNGETLDWHKVKDGVRQKRAGDSSPQLELALDGVLAELDLPVSMDLLNQIFGRDNQRINTDAVAGSLPVLIEHRLDRLRGESVKRESGKVEGKLKLTSDGADLLITPLAGDEPLRFGKAAGASLKRKGDMFVIVENRCTYYRSLQSFITSLPVELLDNGAYKLKGLSENVATLCTALEDLPHALPIQRCDALAQLTGTPQPLETSVSAKEMRGWFEFDVSCRVGELDVDLDDIQRAARYNRPVIRTRDGHWINLNAHELHSVAGQLSELEIDQGNRRLSTQFMDFLNRLERLPNLVMRKDTKALATSLRNRKEPAPLQLSKRVESLLRPYQKEGIEFLYNRCSWQLGSLLADDMGLGKTLQVLSVVSALKAGGSLDGDVLVICPASVILVWQAEIRKFFPSFSVALLNGAPDERKHSLEEANFDIAVCSYTVLRNDLEALNDYGFSMAILDEAQYIRNSSAQVSMAARALNVQQRIALTGTPLENRLNDLWSIMEFLNPGYLGTEKEFEAVYRGESLGSLRKKISPIMLRRRKGEVAKDLPPRIEEIITIPFSPEENDFYRAQMSIARQKAEGRNNMQILAALTRLRQACCHPALVDDEADIKSSKLSYLLEMVEEIVDEGHSVLVFSQFTSMLAIIEDRLNTLQIPNRKLTGETSGKQRQELVKSFSETDDAEVFLLSLKAAGTGLTLTKADYVIIYDPWWNPAAENQAIDRTHRIGQDKPVMAYRLVAGGTVEEKVLALQDEKRELFQSAVEDAEALPTALSSAELASLLE